MGGTLSGEQGLMRVIGLTVVVIGWLYVRGPHRRSPVCRVIGHRPADLRAGGQLAGRLVRHLPASGRFTIMDMSLAIGACPAQPGQGATGGPQPQLVPRDHRSVSSFLPAVVLDQ